MVSFSLNKSKIYKSKFEYSGDNKKLIIQGKIINNLETNLNLLIELLNNTLYDLENNNFYLFIACDLRLEAPILNVRIRKNFNINKNNEIIHIE